MSDGHNPGRVATLSTVIAVNGAVLMFVCMFTPALLQSDGTLARPFALPHLAWPHFMGMFAAMGGLLFVLGDRGGGAVMALVLQVLNVVAALGSGLALMDSAPWFAGGMFTLLLLSLSCGPTQLWSLARATWISGALSSLGAGWFSLVAEPRYGLWLTLMGALAMVVGGGLSEWRLRAVEREHCLPRAALLSSG